jgi:predicted RNase H-like nuclease
MERPTVPRKTAPRGIRTFVGIDGCPGGWIAVLLSPNGIASTAWIRTGGMGTWLREGGSSRLVLIDMPIGLPDSSWANRRGGDTTRGCEREARQLLGPRRSSVFNPPARSALGVAIEEASGENLRELGKKLSRQSLGILPKIREIDEVLSARDISTSGATIWEAHPELAFRALNGGRPMRHWKRTREGMQQRLRLLERFRPGVRAFIRKEALLYSRSIVGVDDLIDAFVLSLSAQRGYPKSYRVLPSVAERDSQKRPMQMVYWDPARS